ncbi:oligosaccharide flippase family protein [Arthrobacter sp. LjRoot78]|uniref:oligosaccharide flippase family protein n=1 Tax=Arthrobacter sp. LjRoot78 TaxID=3342338 RepID=UPI003F5018EF
MSSVKRAAAGAKWAVGCQIFVSLAQFVVSGVTSRIFLPADFGGFAAALSLMGLLTLLTTTGLPSFLLKEHRLSSNHIRSIRRIAILTGGLTATAYVLIAPLWLVLLQAPEGGQFILTMAVAQAFGPTGAVESALLRRETNLKRDAVTVLVTFVAANGAGLLLAVWLRQAWVLGVPLAITPIVLAISACCLQHEVYLAGSSLNKRALFTFGRKITTQNMGFMVLQQAPGWLVSTTLGAAALGHFTKGVALAQMPATALTAIQSRIAQPHWRNIRGRSSFQEAVCDAALLSAGVAFPGFAILSVNGSTLVNLWLGPGWELAGSMTSMLAVGFAFSIPFTLMAGSFEMRGDFGPARTAQWCMAGAMLPPILAMITTRDVLWASWALAISQGGALICLIAVVNWQNPRVSRRLIQGFVQQIAWAAVIGLSGMLVGAVVSRNVQASISAEIIQLAVAAVTSGVVWLFTFRWHTTSAMLVRRGFRLPRLFRSVNV